MITNAIADAIAEARLEAPTRAEVEDTGEATTWSSERGTEKQDDDRRGGRGGKGGRPRRRRAKPEAIAARLKGAEAAEGGDAEGGDDAAE
jgi:small subunit ribosomal protein S2